MALLHTKVVAILILMLSDFLGHTITKMVSEV